MGMNQGDGEIHGGQGVLGFLWPLNDAQRRVFGMREVL